MQISQEALAHNDDGLTFVHHCATYICHNLRKYIQEVFHLI